MYTVESIYLLRGSMGANHVVSHVLVMIKTQTIENKKNTIEYKLEIKIANEPNTAQHAWHLFAHSSFHFPQKQTTCEATNVDALSLNSDITEAETRIPFEMKTDPTIVIVTPSIAATGKLPIVESKRRNCRHL